MFSDAERWIGAEETLTAAFVTKVYKQAGSKFDYTYVPFILNDALAGRNNLTITTNPQHGDLVILDKDGVPTGVEFFNDWLPNGRGRFKTIGIKNNAIARTERSIHSVAGFVHVSR